MDTTPGHPRGPVVAIDGPSGTGKSTIARLLAKCLHCRYVDTGALYRALAVLAERERSDPEDPEARRALLNKFDVRYVEDERGLRVLLAADDVSEEIRRPGIGETASRLSRFREVREALVQRQRQLAAQGSVVMEGRDIGTVVLPGADLKVFLDADPEERAKRRLLEWKNQGVQVPAEQVREEMFTRDQRDRGRELAPLTLAVDAVRIDTTRLTPQEVLDRILALLAERGIGIRGCDFPRGTI
jgi:cytidylate kinase